MSSTSKGIVLITGASTGIGAAAAKYLDAAGYHVFAGVRREADGDKLAANASERFRFLLLDVTRDEDVLAAVQTVEEAAADQGIAGIVNNAGIIIPGPLECLPMDKIRQQFDVNVFGLLRVTQAFLPLVRTGKGRVVLVGSIVGRFSLPFTGAYGATKHAVEGLADVLRVELSSWGIHTALIEPGAIRSEIWDKSMRDGRDQLTQYTPEARTLYGRQLEIMGERSSGMAARAIGPEAVARAIHHALSARRPKTRYLVGNDARMLAQFRRWVPDRLRDWLLRRHLHLHKS